MIQLAIACIALIAPVASGQTHSSDPSETSAANALKAWLGAIEARDEFLEAEGVEFVGSARIQNYQSEGPLPHELHTERSFDFRVFHSNRHHLHELNDPGSGAIDWALFTEGVGGSSLAGNVSLPLQMEYRFGEAPYKSSAALADPIFLGVWSLNGHFVDLFKRAQIEYCDWEEVGGKQFLRVVLDGPAGESGVSDGAWELVIDPIESMLVMSASRFREPRIYDSGVRRSIEVNGKTLECLLKWSVRSIQWIDGIALPRVGLRESWSGNRFTPGREHYMRVEIEVAEPSFGDIGLPDRLTAPLGSLSFDEDLRQWVVAPSSVGNVRGVTKRQLEFFEFFVDPTTVNGAEFPPIDFEEALAGFREGLSVNCAVLAAHLYISAIGMESDIEAVSKEVPIDDQGYSSLLQVSKGLATFDAPVSAVYLREKDLENLAVPALVHLPSRLGGLGHFAVLRPFSGGLLMLVDPPMAPVEFSWEEIVGKEISEVAALVPLGTSIGGAHRAQSIFIAIAGFVLVAGILIWRRYLSKRPKESNSAPIVFVVLSISAVGGCSKGPGAEGDLHGSSRTQVSSGRLYLEGHPGGKIHLDDLVVGEERELELVLVNSGPDLFRIHELDASCTCTEVVVSSKEIQPGESAKLTIGLDVDQPIFRATIQAFGTWGSDPRISSGLVFDISGDADCDRMIVRPSVIIAELSRSEEIQCTLVWSSSSESPPDPNSFHLRPSVNWGVCGVQSIGAPERVRGAWIQQYSVRLHVSKELLSEELADGEVEFHISDGSERRTAGAKIRVLAGSQSQSERKFIGLTERTKDGSLVIPGSRVLDYVGQDWSISLDPSETKPEVDCEVSVGPGANIVVSGIPQPGPFSVPVVIQSRESSNPGSPMRKVKYLLVGVAP